MRRPRCLLLNKLAGVLVLSLVFFFQPAPSFAVPNQLDVTSIERTIHPTANGTGGCSRIGERRPRFTCGGIFSGLDRDQGDPKNVFYAIADRGPNSRITVGNSHRQTFAVPDYNPTIYKLSLVGDRIQIIDQTPILTTSNQPVTGLPNTNNDEIPYTYDGQTRLQLNPNGLDIEGLARASNGTFWVSDEYSPSVA